MNQNADQERLKVVLFSADPLILIGAVEGHRLLGPGLAISPHLKGHRLWLLLKLHYSLEGSKFLDRVVAAYHDYAQQYPEHRVIYLCNTAQEFFLLQQRNVPSILCNHNIFVCEKTFDIYTNESKQFRAIYNARLAPYKRHELCSGVPHVGLIYYAPYAEDPEYLIKLRSQLPNAIFINDLEANRSSSALQNPRARAFVMEVFARNNHVALRPDVVARYCNRARVGLCLSAAEGAMYASMEYLLCGLPVVSTPNRGGRDFYFDADFCTIVPPDPEAVARAVDEFLSRQIAPEYIRQKTLGKMLHDRERFLDFVQAIYQHEGITRSARGDWERAFVHTMTKFVDLGSLLGQIER
jgi:glycosyltransferase involved in cell wall biosynthesis